MIFQLVVLSLARTCSNIPIVDQSGCATHEVLYATAGSKLCQVAGPQHVKAISGNVRQVFEDPGYK